MGFTEIGIKTVNRVEMSKDIIAGSYKFVSEHYSPILLQNFFTIPDKVTF
jgi:hypothetical protein